MTNTRNPATTESTESTETPPARPILGWAADRPAAAFGFNAAAPANTEDKAEPIPDAGEGHLMTIAPTGAGKGRSAIIPALLS